jgi:ribosomal protein S19
MKRSVWKLPFVYQYYVKGNILNENNRIFITRKRALTILRIFVDRKFYIYSGKTFKASNINKFMIGCKLGEFSFTKIRGSAITESLILKGKLKRKEKNKAKAKVNSGLKSKVKAKTKVKSKVKAKTKVKK